MSNLGTGSVIRDIKQYIPITYLFRLVEDIGQMAATTVLAIKHVGHEYTSATLIRWALTSLAGDLAIVIDLQQ